MVLERGKMNQIAIHGEGGHPVADLFLCIRRGFSDGGPDPLEDGLDLAWEGRDVIIYGLGGWVISFHDVPFDRPLTDAILKVNWLRLRRLW